MPYSLRTTNKYIPLICALALAPFFFTHAQATDTAQTDDTQSTLSRLTESLNLVTAIKAGKFPTDAVSLQAAMNDIIRLSEEEIRNVSVELATQNGLTDEEMALRDDLMVNLASAKIHVLSVQTDILQEATPNTIVSIAQKFKEWRDGSYTTTMEQAVRFTSVFKNENSVKAANARLTAILKDEKKIRSLLSASKTAPFMRLIKKAQGELKKASDLNTRAEALLVQNNNTEESNTTIDEMVRQATVSVNIAYDYFVAMSKLIRK